MLEKGKGISMITTKVITLKDGRKMTFIDDQRDFITPAQRVNREAMRRSLLFTVDRHLKMTQYRAHCVTGNR